MPAAKSMISLAFHIPEFRVLSALAEDRMHGSEACGDGVLAALRQFRVARHDGCSVSAGARLPASGWLQSFGPESVSSRYQVYREMRLNRARFVDVKLGGGADLAAGRRVPLGHAERRPSTQRPALDGAFPSPDLSSNLLHSARPASNRPLPVESVATGISTFGPGRVDELEGRRISKRCIGGSFPNEHAVGSERTIPSRIVEPTQRGPRSPLRDRQGPEFDAFRRAGSAAPSRPHSPASRSRDRIDSIAGRRRPAARDGVSRGFLRKLSSARR